jgi:hypothetical protein
VPKTIRVNMLAVWGAGDESAVTVNAAMRV